MRAVLSQLSSDDDILPGRDAWRSDVRTAGGEIWPPSRASGIARCLGRLQHLTGISQLIRHIRPHQTRQWILSPGIVLMSDCEVLVRLLRLS